MKPKSEHDHQQAARAALLDAILPNVAFDGWSQTSFADAINDSGVDPSLAQAACPRGAIDLAVAFHKKGDADMVVALQNTDLQSMRIRDRVAFAIRTRLDTNEPEAVRRGVALFALPQNAAEGSALIWGTADAIWTALGDTSDDLNYYSKRTILSGVYSSTVLYWLGDQSENHADTWAFLDRRIDDVMQFEKVKAKVQASPIGKLFSGFNTTLKPANPNLPGHTSKD